MLLKRPYLADNKKLLVSTEKANSWHFLDSPHAPSLLDNITDTVQHTTGIIAHELTSTVTHSMAWLQSSSSDTVLTNPYFKKDAAPAAQKELVIYCIHGTADRSSAFQDMSDQLLAQAEDLPAGQNLLPTCVSEIHLVAFSGCGRGNPIRHFSEELKSKIIKNKHKNVILLAHSRGLLVAADFAEHLIENSGIFVRGIVGICGPLNGSPLAKPFSWLSESVAEMAHNSDFLRNINLAIAKANIKSQKYFFIGVEHDNIVPLEYTYFHDPAQEGLHSHSISLFSGHTHLSILHFKQATLIVSDCVDVICKRPIEASLETPLNLMSACQEIEAEIVALKNRIHLYYANDKLSILMDLKKQLQEMIDNGNNEFNSNSVGEYIESYLNAPYKETPQTRKQILSQSLNPELFFFKSTIPLCVSCLEKMIQEYKDTPLPKHNISIRPELL